MFASTRPSYTQGKSLQKQSNELCITSDAKTIKCWKSVSPGISNGHIYSHPPVTTVHLYQRPSPWDTLHTNTAHTDTHMPFHPLHKTYSLCAFKRWRGPEGPCISDFWQRAAWPEIDSNCSGWAELERRCQWAHPGHSPSHTDPNKQRMDWQCFWQQPFIRRPAQPGPAVYARWPKRHVGHSIYQGQRQEN